jgi:hypothetical protein
MAKEKPDVVTAAGGKPLEAEREHWSRITTGINHVLRQAG